jgi:hypothetical protein
MTYMAEKRNTKWIQSLFLILSVLFFLLAMVAILFSLLR